MANKERYAKLYRIWGCDGHEQKEAFRPSVRWNTEMASFHLIGADITGSYNYVELVIMADSEEVIQYELEAQLSDGVFENSKYGEVELIGFWNYNPYEDLEVKVIKS